MKIAMTLVALVTVGLVATAALSYTQTDTSGLRAPGRKLARSLRRNWRNWQYKNHGFEYEEEYEYISSAITSTCFPSDASVNVKGQGTRRMEDIKLGDEVEVAGGTFEPVYSFGGHNTPNAEAEMVAIATADLSLSLTPSHWLYKSVGGQQQAVRASDVSVGDMIVVEKGLARAESVGIGIKTGLYSPLTASGTLMVDGVLASTYATTAHPAYIHAVLTPLRVLSKLFPSYIQATNNLVNPVLGIDGETVPGWFTGVDLLLDVATSAKGAAVAGSACVGMNLK